MTLRERLNDIVKRKGEGLAVMSAMLEAADTDKRDLTEAEEADFAYLDTEVERLKKDEARTHKLIEDETVLAEPQRTIRMSTAERTGTPEEFKSLGEFMWAVRFRPQDERLNYIEMDPERSMETREQSMGVGAEGGFAIPTQFLSELKMVDPQAEVFRPRCTIIPAGDPPDASVSFPALDQTAGENIYGGMSVGWVAEGGAKPVTDLKLREVTLTPQEVAGYTVLSDKLLRNWGAASSVITNQLRLCLRGTEDTVFMNGNGVGKPKGVQNSPAKIEITRTTANQIAFADVTAMYARAKFGGNLIWIGSQTILPQLMAMTDAGTNSVWLPGGTAGAATAPPGTLFGLPLLFNERSAGLGSTGDLMLLDLSYYLIKDGSGPFVGTSEHVYYTSNKTVIKIFWNVDGDSWLTEPLQLEGSTANTISPFVILK